MPFKFLSVVIETLYLFAISESVSPGLIVISEANELNGNRVVIASVAKIGRSILLGRLDEP